MNIDPILEEELKRYRDASAAIRIFLMNYRNECSELILQIQGESFENSQSSFDRLHDIQQNLSIALYKYDYHFNDDWKDFVHHLDRDDMYSRKYWYQRFQEGLKWPRE